MSNLAQFRQQHPEYADVPDKQLADALYRKFYSDVPRGDFDKRMGLTAPKAPTAADAKGPTTGRGSQGDPYRIAARFKIGSPEYQQEVRKVPLGGYYEDPQGNIRQRINRGDGQPVRKRLVERLSAAPREAIGAAANLNRGLLIGDEGAALLGTVGNALMGNVGPTTSNPLSVFNGVANSFNNELAKQRAYEDDFTKRRPVTATGFKTAGAVPTFFVPGGAPAQATTRTAAIANAAGNAALYAGTSGLLDRGTWEERNKQGTVNALIAAPFAGGVTAALTRTGRARLPRSPGVDELANRRTQAYNASDAAGVRYSQQGYDDMVTAMEQDLASVRLNPMRHPKAASMLEELQGLRGTTPTLTEVDQLRQVIRRDVANAKDEAEAFMGKRMIRELDNFLNNATGGQVMQGSGANGAALINAARDANTRYAKSQDITEALDSAALRTGSTGSGGNIDNAIRQNLRRELETGANWTPDEEAALREIVLGTRGQNTLRQFGKLSPQGNGLIAALNLASAGTGGVVGGPAGALVGMAPGTVGLVSKHFADRITQQKVTRLLDLIAAGGVGAQQARQAIIQLPNGAQFLDDLSRVTGLTEAAANQSQPAIAATASQ